MRKCLLTLLVLIVLTPHAFAQESALWRVFLYNDHLKQLRSVALDGQQTAYSLDLDNARYVLSRDETRIAIGRISVLDNAEGSDWTATLIVHDLVSGTDVAEFAFDDVSGIEMGEFNEDGTQLTLTIGRNDPHPSNPPPIWSLLLLDVVSGTMKVIADEQIMQPFLAVDNRPAPHRGWTRNWSDTRQFENNEVIFALTSWYGYTSLAPAYRWSATTGHIEPEQYVWGRGGAKYLEPIEEFVWVDFDPKYPTGWSVDRNVVMVADRDGNERVVFHDSQWFIFSADFIENGQLLMVSMWWDGDYSPEYDYETMRWVTIDRNGVVSELGTWNRRWAIHTLAGPDGYLTLTPQRLAGQPFQFLDYVTFAGTRHLTEFLNAASESEWIFIGASQMAPSEVGELPPFRSFDEGSPKDQKRNS